MDKRYGILIVSVTIFVLCFVGTASARTWSVDDNDKANFRGIPDAINNASVGDTILVYSGIYYEEVVVDKSVTLKGIGHPVVDTGGEWDAITLSADGITLVGFTATNSGFSYAGIKVTSNNNTITGNTFVNDGLIVLDSYQNTVENNTVNGKPLVYLEDASDYRVDDAGQVILVNCNNITVENQDLSNTSVGIELWETKYSKILNNTVSNNIVVGVYLYESNNNNITGNNVSNNNECGIYLATSSNNTIIGNNASNNDNGIYLSHSSNNNTITGNNVCNNHYHGVIIYDSSNNNTITGNNVSNNDDGILLRRSSNNNTITGNNVSNNDNGIGLSPSSNNTITGNNVSNNDDGILLRRSSNNNTITGNNVSNNDNGIGLSHSSNNTITGNTFIDGGLSVYETYQNTVENNTVNGKPLVYLEDVSDYKVEDAGQVILVNCNNITVENLVLSNTSVGIKLWKTENSKILNNTASNNDNGISLDYSRNNTIIGNNVSGNNDNGIQLYKSNNNTITGNNVSNNWDGIYLFFSSNNNICLNNFINNGDTVLSLDSANIWNTTEEIAYIYDGTTYESYLGNYMSDYEVTDTDGDGIGDTFFVIYPDRDIYPLMQPFENYNILTPANVVIWNAHHDAAGDDDYNLNDEYLVLKNVGGESINLEGWNVMDKKNHTYVFPHFELLPNTTVTIHTGFGTNSASDIYGGSGRAIWDNDGDTVYFFDADGILIDTKSW